MSQRFDHAASAGPIVPPAASFLRPAGFEDGFLFSARLLRTSQGIGASIG